MPDGPQLHPHIFAPRPARTENFTSPKSARDKISFPDRVRAEHAEKLLAQLEVAEREQASHVQEQKAEGIDTGNGIYLLFKGAPGFDLKFESLDVARAGIELCAVRQLDDTSIQAAVFVPDGKLGYFLKKVVAYRDQDTKPTEKKPDTRPKNEGLVASIEDIQLAALNALWTDRSDLYPRPEEPATWEVWLRRGNIDHAARLREFAAKNNLVVSEYEIKFIDRVVVLVHGRGLDLARSNELLGALAEIRLAKATADFFTSMNAVDQQAWVDNLIARLKLPPGDCPYLCLLDTGLNRAHPLVAWASEDEDCHTYKPAWGVDDRFGHGTPMAGLALYGDLIEPFANALPVALTHRIESVKLINQDDPHAQDLYGAVTQECVSRVEVKPDRRRIFCMAISASDARDLGRPSSWSAAIDAIISGYNDGQRRLMIVSAGNTVRDARGDYPSSNYTDSVHDPAQAWNAITVGGYTEKATVDQTRYEGWQPLASPGLLAPCSCTSITWKSSKWPIKPDLVLEAGNMAKHADYDEPDYVDDALSLLTLPTTLAAESHLSHLEIQAPRPPNARAWLAWFRQNIRNLHLRRFAVY